MENAGAIAKVSGILAKLTRCLAAGRPGGGQMPRVRDEESALKGKDSGQTD